MFSNSENITFEQNALSHAVLMTNLSIHSVASDESIPGFEFAPVSGAFATKDFAFATKICPIVAFLRLFYGLAYNLIISNSLVSYL